MGFAMIPVIKFTIGPRAADAEQDLGPDITEHGVYAYDRGMTPLPVAGDD